MEKVYIGHTPFYVVRMTAWQSKFQIMGLWRNRYTDEEVYRRKFLIERFYYENRR